MFGVRVVLVSQTLLWRIPRPDRFRLSLASGLTTLASLWDPPVPPVPENKVGNRRGTFLTRTRSDWTDPLPILKFP